TPLNAVGYYSFTFDDFAPLKDNLSFYRKEDYPDIETDLLASAHEIGEIFTKNATAIVLRSINPEQSRQSLHVKSKIVDTHRCIDIFSFSDTDYFHTALYPLIAMQGVQYYTQIDNFYIFAQSRSTLEDIIANVKNKTVLAKQKSFQKASKNLVSAASLEIVGINKNLLGSISRQVKSGLQEAYKKAHVD